MSASSNRRKKRERVAAAEIAEVTIAVAVEDDAPSDSEPTVEPAAEAQDVTQDLAAIGDADPEAGPEAEPEPESEEQGEDGGDEAHTLRAVSDIAPASGAPDVDRERIKQALEALIFVSERIVTPAQLARGVKARAALVRELVAELMQEYRGRGIELIEVGNGYQFRSAHACADFVREFVSQKPVRLTRAQLETLALIAYRQPVTRPEIDDVRGVDSGSAMRVLLERNLIKMLGRKDEPGRPLLYGTSPYFLEFFSMRSLKDLPTLREFTDLSDENRALFKRKTGESVEDAEAELAAASEAARLEEEQGGHISDEDLAAIGGRSRRSRGRRRTLAAARRGRAAADGGRGAGTGRGRRLRRRTRRRRGLRRRGRRRRRRRGRRRDVNGPVLGSTGAVLDHGRPIANDRCAPARNPANQKQL